MKVLLTGIEGFVGRHLAVTLMEHGHEPSGTVWRSDDLQRAARELGAVPLMQVDLRYGSSFEGPLSAFQPECVIHLAAQSSGALSYRQPVATYRINVLGTLNVLEVIRKTGWEGRFLFVSTGEVYGKMKTSRPFRESDPVSPINNYATSKAMAEMAVLEYGRTYGLRTIITRAFPHTGPGQSDGFALSSFARQIALIEKKGAGKLRVGNLDAERDYLDVRDVAEAYVALIERGTDGDVYNIASGNSYRIGDLLERLIDLSEADIRVTQDEQRMRKIDIPRLTGDPDKLGKHTGWRAKIDIERTLQDLLDHWRGRAD